VIIISFIVVRKRNVVRAVKYRIREENMAQENSLVVVHSKGS
jgi:hypothetical protein